MGIKDHLELIERLAAEEKTALQADFLAPVVRGSKVRLRVNGVITAFTVDGPFFEGWAVLRVSSTTTVRVVRVPSRAEILQYLSNLPQVKFVLVDEFEGCWYGLQSHPGQRGIATEGPIPLRLVDRGQRFMAVLAHFDGQNFWYAGADQRRGQRVGGVLRQRLAERVLPKNVQRDLKGSVEADRVAYKMVWEHMFQTTPLHERTDLSESDRAALALRHAGASMTSYINDNAHTATVRFMRDGRQHTVRINRRDMQVVSAGICLSGRDREFDLASLVSVFREREDREW